MSTPLQHVPERVACDWATCSPTEDNAEWISHHAHGDDLSQCDAWVCHCGNRADLEGFEPTWEEMPQGTRAVAWTCSRCGIGIGPDGRFLK